MIRTGASLAAAVLLAACMTPAPTSAPPGVAASLAPTGKLHAAINFGNAVLAAFVEDMKASGFVADALRANGIEGAAVAPPGPR